MNVSGLTRTLRGRLILRYAVVLAALILLLGGFQYVALERYLMRQTSEALHKQAKAAWAGLGTNFSGDLASVAGSLTGSLGAPKTLAVVIDLEGKLLSRRGGPPHDELRLSGEPLANGEVPARRPKGRDYLLAQNDKGEKWIVVFEPLTAARKTYGFVQLATPLHDVDEVLYGLLLYTILGGAVGLILAAAMGWMLMTGALRPLDRVVEVSGEIASGNLSRRVEVTGATAEIERVGRALNHMLDRITESLAAEREAKDRMRQFLADAAHELRTPVTAINGFLEVLQSGAVENQATLERSLSSMHTEGQRLARMISGLLTLSRFDRQPHLEMAPLDLSGLVSGLMPALQMSAGDHPISLTAPAPVWVRGNADSLRQVIWNLVDNGAKYSPNGRPIEVRCSSDGDSARLEIRDQGQGIPAADLPRVFDRFFRGERSRSRQTGGAGLGLAIVQSIVTAHGGRIEIESEPGDGTKVTVLLSLISPEGRPSGAKS